MTSQSRAELARERFALHIQTNALKNTRQRLLVLDVLLVAEGHLTAQELTDLIKKTDSSIGLTTVYRTLRLLVEAGVVDERHFKDSQARFEVAELGDHHDHLICTVCGQIFEFENDEIEKLQEEIATSYGLVIQRHRHEIYAECRHQVECEHRKSLEDGRIP